MADTVLCFGLFGLLLTLRVLIHYANLELHVRKIAEAAKTPQQRQTKGSYCPELEEVELGYGGVVTHTKSRPTTHVFFSPLEWHVLCLGRAAQRLA